MRRKSVVKRIQGQVRKIHGPPRLLTKHTANKYQRLAVAGVLQARRKASRKVGFPSDTY
jgi:hypothetical protein